jgi:hypothetical protein
MELIYAAKLAYFLSKSMIIVMYKAKAAKEMHILAAHFYKHGTQRKNIGHWFKGTNWYGTGG